MSMADAALTCVAATAEADCGKRPANGQVERGQGIGPDAIPEAGQRELVDLVWIAPEGKR